MLTIGCDPELFVRNPNHGAFVSGYGLIPGTKQAPFPVAKGAVQVDGMALEFNIDPAEDEDAFVGNITEVTSHLKRMVTGYDLVFDPVAEFTDEYMAEQPPEAKVLGCDPDMNAWSISANHPPNPTNNFRTAAGHVHVGWTENADTCDIDWIIDCATLARQLDFYLGLPSLLYDKDTKRREMYGRAGAFRAKPYGLEYRVLSNVWCRSENLTRWVYRNTKQAYEELCDGKRLEDKYGDIQDIINTSDVDKAKTIIDREFICVPNIA
jgi:hypothetical protein